MNSFVYNALEFSEKITSFSFLEYFDAFELDANVVNFVHYEKTRINQILHFDIIVALFLKNTTSQNTTCRYLILTNKLNSLALECKILEIR